MISPTKVESQIKLQQRIHILGSCATRDIFRIVDRNNFVGKYTSRSSLISRISPPLKFDLSSQLKYLESSWQQRMLKQDFEKNGVFLEDYAKGFLIIDFIDERLQLLKIKDSFVTKSTEFVRCELDRILEETTLLRRGKQQDFELWVDACYKFTEKIPQEIRQKTILHKAFWAATYYQDNKMYDFEDHKKIKFYNKNLAYYYDTFESIYSPGHIVETTPNYRIADANHRWGLASFHYVPKYYKECYQQIMDFIKLQNF